MSDLLYVGLIVRRNYCKSDVLSFGIVTMVDVSELLYVGVIVRRTYNTLPLITNH